MCGGAFFCPCAAFFVDKAPPCPLQAQQQNTDPITYTDLYEWGLSGSANASERRRTFLRILGLPPRLSKKEIIQVLNTLYTRDALQAQLQAMK